MLFLDPLTQFPPAGTLFAGGSSLDNTLEHPVFMVLLCPPKGSISRQNEVVFRQIESLVVPSSVCLTLP